MPDPIRQLTLAELATLLAVAKLTRSIDQVHVHHTWRPRRRDFRGLTTIEGMRKYHMETNGWSDIAQHLTIDPAGGLWTGRNWNQSPASSSGQNGDSKRGPFMLEMVGDFDEGEDPFDGPQRAAAVEVTARVVQRFRLDPNTAIRFHRELGSPKTCPGTGIDRDAFVGEVVAWIAEHGNAAATAARATSRAFATSPPQLASGTAIRDVTSSPFEANAEIVETEAAGRAIDDFASRATLERQHHAAVERPVNWSRSNASRGGTWPDLELNAISLSRGELSTKGGLTTSPDDLDAIVDGIRRYAARTEVPRVVLYAHGGLVGEGNALAYARAMLPWWIRHGVYPVFFIWETGFLETIGQYLIGKRDFADYTSDPALEIVARLPATALWSGMKESARRAASPDACDGNPGGAWLFSELLAAHRAELGRKFELHAVGHSAGSIFHSHLLPRLMDHGFRIATLSLLAPAVRIDQFSGSLLPAVQDGRIGRLSMFTMEEEAERQDDVGLVYRKSLLYFVSRACEGLRRQALVGLEQSLRKDATLAALFGLRGESAGAELQRSLAPGKTPNPLTRALHHGDFDNDPATMGSVLRRILGLPDGTAIGSDSFPFRLDPERAFGSRIPPPPSVGRGVRQGSQAAGGSRRALCIGIDAYPQAPLAGCVNDSQAWAIALATAGFAVEEVHDQQATRQGLVDAIDRLISSAKAGDVLVLQYAGHGTQLPDLDGDETDGYDEAIVPHDYASGAFLLDDDLGRMASRLPAGSLLTLIMDCCHAGTNSRFAPLLRARTNGSDRVRYLPPSAELIAAHEAYRGRLRASGPAVPASSLPGVIHLAACQDDEFAWETDGHGDFTTAGTRLLASMLAQRATNESFIGAVRDELRVRNRQHPQMMPPPADLAGRPMLAARVGGAIAQGGDAQAGDDEILGHLQAVLGLLAARRQSG